MTLLKKEKYKCLGCRYNEAGHFGNCDKISQREAKRKSRATKKTNLQERKDILSLAYNVLDNGETDRLCNLAKELSEKKALVDNAVAHMIIEHTNKVKAKADAIKEEYLASKKEAVNHPEHYGGENNPYEAIKIIEALGLGFNLGNVIKYLVRIG